MARRNPILIYEKLVFVESNQHVYPTRLIETAKHVHGTSW